MKLSLTQVKKNGEGGGEADLKETVRARTTFSSFVECNDDMVKNNTLNAWEAMGRRGI